jgi:hypothetical protein
MIAHLPGVTPPQAPQGANVAIRIELTAQANITPFVARQAVTGFWIVNRRCTARTGGGRVGRRSAAGAIVDMVLL